MGEFRGYRILIPRGRWLVFGASVSLGAHLLLFGGYSLIGERVERVIQRITFEPPPPPGVFYKPPRVATRALEFRKRPIPRGALLRRHSRITETRVSAAQALAATRTEALLRRLDARQIAPASLRRAGRMGVGDGPEESAASGVELALPALSQVEVRGVKESRRQVDMRLDMLSVRDMDTGQYQAMVIQDPDDRRKVTGYIHLAQVLTRSRTSVGGATAVVRDNQVTRYQSLDYLIKALQEYTGIQADYLGAIPLDDPRLGEVPWLLMPNWFGLDHTHSEQELANLGRYLASGGFAIATSGVQALRRALRSQRLNEGSDWRIDYLEPSHPIYHAYFDFDMSVRDNSARVEYGDQGLFIGERLAVFLPESVRIATASANPASRAGTAAYVDGTRHLQFTVNTVVFALTQEGGLTQQLMAGLQ